MNLMKRIICGIFFSIFLFQTPLCAAPKSLPSVLPVDACSIAQSGKDGPVLSKGFLDKEVCRVYAHEECEVTNTCDLLNVGFWVKHFTHEEKKTHSVEPEAGSMLYAWYETKSLDALEKYVFVQYLRGCAYFVMYKDGGENMYFDGIEHAGVRNSTFCFPDWEIDMSANDPAYTSEGGARHQYAQWTDIPRQFPSKYAKEYGTEKPVYPLLGMVDSPSRAFVRKWGNGRILAYNTVLEFRTCLYRINDVPRDVGAKEQIAAQPLRCINWESKHVYDPKTDQIESPIEFSPICLKPKDPYVPFELNK